MKLSSLITQSDILSPNILQDLEVTAITADSRDVQPGALFFCIVGAKVDARVFISEAFQKGAVAVVYDGELLLMPEGLTIQVTDVRRSLSAAANRFYREPSLRLRNIAITGTSGKTSVAWILSHALHMLGEKTFMGGTLGFKVLEDTSGKPQSFKELSNTTMDPISVQRFLAEALREGAQASVFEATSQGVVQSRMRDVAWDGAIFTNLSRDHLDLHGTMGQYEAAKRELFIGDLANSPKHSKFAIFNFDDAAARRIGCDVKLTSSQIEVVSFAQSPSQAADFKLLDLTANTSGLSFRLSGRGCELPISSALVGLHNASNLACAALALWKCGYSAKQIEDTLGAIPPVPGRLEPVTGANRTVYVDYAHKPDALEKILLFLKPLCRGRVIAVIGCGGDRDKGKRPVMGEIARRLADVTVVTSDNPRTESPEEIIKQVVSGITDKDGYPLIIEVDRRTAIEAALKMATPEDVVVVAGKGHEPYQEIHGVKHHFSDVEVVREILGGM